MEVTGSNPVEALNFFSGFFFPNYINWLAHGEDRVIACFSPPCKIISFILSPISFMGKIEPTKMTCLPVCGFIAQLVVHRTSMHGGHGFESRCSPEFFSGFFFPNCINWWAHGEERAIACFSPPCKIISFILPYYDTLV